jgi:hypothetical protein
MRDMWQINISTVQMKINNKIKETSFLSSAFFLIPNLPFPLFIHVCCKMHKLKEFILHVSLIFFWLISFFQISIKINNRRILLLNSQFLSPLISSSFVSKWRLRETKERYVVWISKEKSPFSVFHLYFSPILSFAESYFGEGFWKKKFTPLCKELRTNFAGKIWRSKKPVVAMYLLIRWREKVEEERVVWF